MTNILARAVLDAMAIYEARYGSLPDDITQAMKFRAGQSQESIEDEYATTLYEIMDDYANHERPVTAYRNRYNRAVNDAMNGSAVAGWVDGGADGQIPGELQDWINERISQEIEFVSDMFRGLKELRAEGDADKLASFIGDRAQGYAATLEGVFLRGKTYAMGERPGVWRFGATEEHCTTCSELDGNTHPLSWYRENGYIPRQSGSTTLECGGWHCDCRVEDPDTGEQLL
jgi:hypothetical protein